MMDAREVAGKLTKAQREWLTDGPPVNGRGQYQTREALRRKRLLTSGCPPVFTHLALQVAALVTEKDTHE